MSTLNIYKNTVDQETIDQLVHFSYTDKEGLDIRPDNISKNIDWSQDTWIKQTVKKILDHIPSEDLYGMSFDQCWEWTLGDVITQDRTQIHATAGGPTGKLFLTIFTVNK